MLHAGLSTVLGGRNPWRYCGRHGEILSAEHPPHLTHTHTVPSSSVDDNI